MEKEQDINEGNIAGLIDFYYNADDIAREQLENPLSSEVVYAMLYVMVRLEPGKHWEQFIREALNEVIDAKYRADLDIEKIALLIRKGLH